MTQTTATAKKIILLVGDAILLYGALALTLILRYGQQEFALQWDLHAEPFTAIFVLWLVILYISDLYNIQKAKNNVHFYRRFFEALIGAGAIAIGFFYAIPFFEIAPKTNLVIVMVMFAVFFTIWRMLFNHAIAPRILRRRVLFIGYTAEMKELIQLFSQDTQLGYLPVALVPLCDDDDVKSLKNTEVYSTLNHIRAIVTAHEIDTVVLNLDMGEQYELTQELYELIFWNLTIINGGTLYEHITGRIPLSVLSESWFLENLQSGYAKGYDMFRFVFDVILAAALLAVTAVLTPFIAIALKSTSPGPIFFAQKRVGKNGKPFTLYKFRTMHALAKDGSAELENTPQLAQKNDTRITKVGALLRKTRLDEFPQALNIIKGEMSFIGPRPERPEYIAKLEKSMPFFTVRNIVRPGLTGWAQINYPYAGTIKEMVNKLQYDLYYIKNRSIMIDVAILLKTINTVLRRKGR